MSNAQHTPGPWAANSKHVACDNQAEIVIEQADGSAPIAKVFQIYGDQLQKNARLIAAAPELLAALKSMVNYGNLGAYERADAMKAARAAITKATGQ